MKKFTGFIIAVITVIVCINHSACGHQPVFSNNVGDMRNAVMIDDPLVSHVVYGDVSEDKHVDFIMFNAKKGDCLYIEMSVPLVKGSTDFKPSFALISKGLPSRRGEVPFTVPEGWGYLAFNESVRCEEYFEPLTQTYYIRRQKIRMLAPTTGEYYIAIYSHENKTGKYSVSIGEKEKFELMDVIAFPYLWFRVKYWFNPIKAVSTLIVLLVAILGIIYYVRRQK